jgi:hypothetical protein
MISYKKWLADGDTTRFLSDFIIRSEQYCRVYAYIYDAEGVEGEVQGDYKVRTNDLPNTSEDLVGLDKWDLVDNNISFYTAPTTGVSIYIEVATTAEEFGTTLLQPSVQESEDARDAALVAQAAAEEAQAAAEAAQAESELIESNLEASGQLKVDEAQAKAWEAEAFKLTADSYANEPENIAVKIYTSNGNGTFTATNTNPVEYSAFHWKEKAVAVANVSMDSLNDVDTSGKQNGDALVYNSTTDTWEAASISTPTPTVTITSTLNENTTVNDGLITDYNSDFVYVITADNGVISNVNGATFSYTAPDITDGDDDIDYIRVTASFGFFTSEENVTTMTITYLPVVADDAYVDNLTVDDSEYNEGWNIV